MRKKTIILFIIISIIILQIIFSLNVNANNSNKTSGTLYVELKRDEQELNKINIIATDKEYDITELKYAHKYVELDEINYFEENNSDVYTFDINPSKEIKLSFLLDGYGSYTVYAKNSRGDKFLSRITLKDPSEYPSINLIKDKDNPLHITIEVTSKNNIIQALKIAKKENPNENIDFSKEGTNIEFIPSSNVSAKYTQITEPGIYVIYAQDNQGYESIYQIYLDTQTTPIYVDIFNEETARQVRIKATNTICNIIKIKVAKESEITTFEDFKNKGEDLEFTQGKNVDIIYIAPEDNTYVFYFEDELGYQKMVYEEIFEEKKDIQISIAQLDNKNKGDLTISATNNICDIVKMKVEIGDNIDLDYFKENGEEITIIRGKSVIGKYSVKNDCIINVYVEDEHGYSYMLTKNILGIDEQNPIEKPIITLQQDSNNPKQINVTVTSKDSYIRRIKWAEGSKEISYFKDNGNVIGEGLLGKIIETNFNIDKTGVYTLYAIDESGNEVTKEIVIYNLELDPITSNNYKIDNNKKIIYNIPSNTTKQFFDELITTNASYKIVNNNGIELKQDDILGTGMKLNLSGNIEYILIIIADISGDGNVTTTDLVKAKRNVVGLETLEEIEMIAADANIDGKISVTDIIKIKQHIVGIIAN